ncbi:MAG: HD domain-containing protein [Thermoleophilia bacterium]
MTDLGPRFTDALGYAVEAHAEQRRKGTGIPYVAHLLAVAALVIEDGGRDGDLSEDEAIAALLHDVVEDQGGRERLADVRARFGERVAQIVEACSDSLEATGPKAPWRGRKEAYLAHLESADPGVLRVSLADKVHNSRAILDDYRDIGDALWTRFRPESDPLWYYGALSEVFSRRRPGRLADELAGIVAELRAELGSDGLRDARA